MIAVTGAPNHRSTAAARAAPSLPDPSFSMPTVGAPQPATGITRSSSASSSRSHDVDGAVSVDRRPRLQDDRLDVAPAAGPEDRAPLREVLQIRCRQSHLRMLAYGTTMPRMQMPAPTERALEAMHAIGDDLADRGVIRGKMFGVPSLKAGGKVLCSAWNDELVVKLPPSTLAEALALSGAEHFEPMAGRAMKEWAQVPYSHRKRWPTFVEASLAYVTGGAA